MHPTDLSQKRPAIWSSSLAAIKFTFRHFQVVFTWVLAVSLVMVVVQILAALGQNGGGSTATLIIAGLLSIIITIYALFLFQIYWARLLAYGDAAEMPNPLRPPLRLIWQYTFYNVAIYLLCIVPVILIALLLALVAGAGAAGGNPALVVIIALLVIPLFLFAVSYYLRLLTILPARALDNQEWGLRAVLEHTKRFRFSMLFITIIASLIMLLPLLLIVIPLGLAAAFIGVGQEFNLMSNILEAVLNVIATYIYAAIYTHVLATHYLTAIGMPPDNIKLV